MKEPLLTITAVGYGFRSEWLVFMNSLMLQTSKRWTCQLINDGPDDGARRICSAYVDRYPEHFSYEETSDRHNDFGHTLRGIGLRRTTTRYWATQNVDNYLVPRYVELVTAGMRNSDMVVFPCVHSYEHVNERGDPPYTVLDVSPARNRCDAGTIVVKTDLAQRVGWSSIEKNSDGDFIEDLMASNPAPVVSVLPNVLMVHN